MKTNSNDLAFPWVSVFIQALAAGWIMSGSIFRDKLDTMEEFNAGMSYLLGACMGLAILGQIMVWANKLSKRVAALEEKLSKSMRPEE
ncbi:MAG: hypothetical protein Q8M07_07360 [Prosthecobacter sp.]|nr:hypothetical protein [Prosthecobacter sp.]